MTDYIAEIVTWLESYAKALERCKQAVDKLKQGLPKSLSSKSNQLGEYTGELDEYISVAQGYSRLDFKSLSDGDIVELHSSILKLDDKPSVISNSFRDKAKEVDFVRQDQQENSRRFRERYSLDDSPESYRDGHRMLKAEGDLKIAKAYEDFFQSLWKTMLNLKYSMQVLFQL